MTYALLKSLHIVAVIVWMTGLLSAPIVLNALSRIRPAGRAEMAQYCRRWFLGLNTPAMLLTWGLGLALISVGQWQPAPWIGLKVLCVLILSGLHGFYSGRFRKLSKNFYPPEDRAEAPMWLFWGSLMVLASISVLVIFKP